MSSFLYCLPHMNKNTPVTDLKGIGPKTAELFYSRGIHTAGDLLTYYPVNYETFDPPVRPADALPGRTVTLALTISGRPVRAGSGARRIVHIKAAGEGTEPYIGNSLPVGSRHYFRGTLGRTGAGLLYMEQPGIYSPAAYAGIQGTMQPRYSLTRGLKNNQVKKAVGQVLEEYVFPEDYIPEEDRALLDLTGLRQAYRQIHFPMNMEELSEARRRLIFDEFFEFILSVRRQKEAGEELINTRPMEDRPEVEALTETGLERDPPGSDRSPAHEPPAAGRCGIRQDDPGISGPVSVRGQWPAGRPDGPYRGPGRSGAETGYL